MQNVVKRRYLMLGYFILNVPIFSYTIIINMFICFGTDGNNTFSDILD